MIIDLGFCCVWAALVCLAAAEALRVKPLRGHAVLKPRGGESHFTRGNPFARPRPEIRRAILLKLLSLAEGND